MVRGFVNVKQAAAIAGVCQETIRRLADQGVIEGRKAGFGKTSPLLVKRSDLTKVREAYEMRRKAMKAST